MAKMNQDLFEVRNEDKHKKIIKLSEITKIDKVQYPNRKKKSLAAGISNLIIFNSTQA